MKDPAFLFYSNDFDAATKFFSNEQVGIYMRLLIAQHQHGRLYENQVNFICKSYDNDIMKKFIKDDDGLYYNERLEAEINRRKAYSESRSNNKKGKGKQIVTSKKQVKNTSKSYDNHMETETEIENDTNTKKVEFEKFWNLYDYKKGDKDKIFKKWLKLTQTEIGLIMDYTPKYVASTPNKEYRKHPETFLNNKSWNDEITHNHQKPDLGKINPPVSNENRQSILDKYNKKSA